MLHEMVDGILILLIVIAFAFIFGDLPASWCGDRSLVAKVIAGGTGALIGLFVGWIIVSAGVFCRNTGKRRK